MPTKHAMGRHIDWMHRNRAIFVIAIVNFHCRPEIAGISDALFKRDRDIKVRTSIASDCDLIPRFPSENGALSAEFPCDYTCEGKSLRLRFAISLRSAHRIRPKSPRIRGKPGKPRVRLGCVYIYIYIYAVESKLGPRFGFFWVKTWSKVGSKLGPRFFWLVLPSFIVFWSMFKITNSV